MSPIQFSRSGKNRLIIGITLLLSMSGCVGYVERPGARGAYVSAGVRAEAVFIEQEDYVYYPRYQMYYGSRSHQYYYQDGSAWVSRSEPRGVTASVLISAPSVTMEFHDRPALHHAQIIQTYPRTWVKSSGKAEHKTDGRKKSRDDNRDENKR